MNYENAINNLMKADRLIKKSHRYACGIEEGSEDIKEERARFFFNSPDGQNSELYYQLRELGWRNSGYNAPYYWGVSKDGVHIQYTEGDVYLTPLKK